MQSSDAAGHRRAALPQPSPAAGRRPLSSGAPEPGEDERQPSGEPQPHAESDGSAPSRAVEPTIPEPALAPPQGFTAVPGQFPNRAGTPASTSDPAVNGGGEPVSGDQESGSCSRPTLEDDPAEAPAAGPEEAAPETSQPHVGGSTAPVPEASATTETDHAGPDPRLAEETRQPLGVVRKATGQPSVDTLLDRLADADDLPVPEHLAVYEDVHGGLRQTLTALDQRPGVPAPGIPHNPRS